MPAAISRSVLLFRVGERTCALQLAHVLEVMRPLAVDQVAHTPDFVQGISVIRGAPTPVVSLASLLAEGGGRPARFVVVRVGERQVALAVDAVLGVCELDPATCHALPPVAQQASGAKEAATAMRVVGLHEVAPALMTLSGAGALL